MYTTPIVHPPTSPIGFFKVETWSKNLKRLQSSLSAEFSWTFMLVSFIPNWKATLKITFTEALQSNQLILTISLIVN